MRLLRFFDGVDSAAMLVRACAPSISIFLLRNGRTIEHQQFPRDSLVSGYSFPRVSRKRPLRDHLSHRVSTRRYLSEVAVKISFMQTSRANKIRSTVANNAWTSEKYDRDWSTL